MAHYTPRVVASLAFAVLVSGCASTTVQVKVLHPAEIDLVGIRRIALGEISGTGGEELAGTLVMGLFNTGRFEILDRQHLETLMREHQLAAGGLVNPETAAQTGSLVGSAAIVVGRVTEHRFTETLEVGNPKKDDEGNEHRKYTRRGTARVAATLQITDIATGRVIAVRQPTTVKSATLTSTDAIPGHIDPSPLLAAAREECVADFLRAVAPHEVNESVEFEDDDDLPGTKRGIEFAKGGDLERAVTTFQEVVALHSTKARTHYNLGLALLCLGRYDEAIASLDLAYGMTASRKYARTLARAREWKANAERLRQQSATGTP
jgi:hypothetical protein